MKNVFAFTLALSALVTSAAFASPQHTATSASVGTAHVATEKVMPVAQVSEGKSTDGFKQALDSGVLVAETRREFGSQYQRY